MAQEATATMRVFRDVECPTYVYYIQHEGITILWYPEMEWRHRPVEVPEGRLLAEGTAEEVTQELRQVLPADLLNWLRMYYGIEVDAGVTVYTH